MDLRSHLKAFATRWGIAVVVQEGPGLIESGLHDRKDSPESPVSLGDQALDGHLVVVVGFYAIFPNFTSYFFAGEKGSQIAGLIGWFGLAMAIFAIVKLLAFYHLALEKKGFIWLFVVASIAEVAGIMLFHDSLKQVIIVMILIGAFLLVANLVLAFREEAQADGCSDSSEAGNLPIE